MKTPKKDIVELNSLWNTLGDIPINENEEIEESFLHFGIGTSREDIWLWFESQNSDFSVIKSMGI